MDTKSTKNKNMLKRVLQIVCALCLLGTFISLTYIDTVGYAIGAGTSQATYADSVYYSEMWSTAVNKAMLMLERQARGELEHYWAYNSPNIPVIQEADIAFFFEGYGSTYGNVEKLDILARDFYVQEQVAGISTGAQDDISMDLEGTLYIGLSEGYLHHANAYFAGQFYQGQVSLLSLTIFVLVTTACIAALMAIAIKRKSAGEIRLFDRIYLDIHAGILFVVGIAVVALFMMLSPQIGYLATVFNGVALLLLALAFIIYSIWVGFYLNTFVKWAIKGQVAKRIFIIIVLPSTINRIKAALYGMRPSVRQMVYTLAYCAAIILLLLAVADYAMGVALLLIMAISIVFGYLSMKSCAGQQRLATAIAQVRMGDYAGAMRFEGNTILQRKIGEDVLNIAEGIQTAVDAQVKAQRLKTDLITNVSHDLKTPLTSIIAYVDLLKQIELDAPASEYVQVLEQKSQRLKHLCENLFDAAKASSGDMPVNLRGVDIGALIKQALGEMADKMAASQLEFRLSITEESTAAMADGELLFRVIQNVFSNIFKYAMPMTRVYIDVYVSQERIYISAKNISREPLNMDSEALMERFVRGDAARTGEGSGLGLNIAKDLMRLQSGTFDVTIDGDLFKVTLALNRVLPFVDDTKEEERSGY